MAKAIRSKVPNRSLAQLVPNLWVWWQDDWARVVNVIGDGLLRIVTLARPGKFGVVFKTRPICAALTVHGRRGKPREVEDLENMEKEGLAFSFFEGV